MRIETFTINVAVKDSVGRDVIERVVCYAMTLTDRTVGVFGVEIEQPDKPAAPTPIEAPRQKRKYQRKAKPVEPDADTPVRRVKREDGTTVEQRGNCQGGGAA